MLTRLGISPADLQQSASHPSVAPTFAQYVPVVVAAVGDSTRRVYGSYWNRLLERWADRRLDEITPSDIGQLVTDVTTRTVIRRNARGGRSAAEHLIAALRCLYHHAVADGHITAVQNPASKVDKPRRLPSTRRPSPTINSSRSTPSPRVPATTPTSTPCSFACTPKPPAGAGEPFTYARPISTATRCSFSSARKATPPAGNPYHPP